MYLLMLIPKFEAFLEVFLLSEGLSAALIYRYYITCIKRNADVSYNACKDIALAVNIGKTKYMEIGRHRGMIAKCAYIGSNSYEKVKPLNT